MTTQEEKRKAMFRKHNAWRIYRREISNGDIVISNEKLYTVQGGLIAKHYLCQEYKTENDPVMLSWSIVEHATARDIAKYD